MKKQNINQNLITRKGGIYLIKHSSLPSNLVRKAEKHFNSNILNQALKILDRVYWKLHEKNRLGSTWHFSKDYKRKVGSHSTFLWKELVKLEILVCNGKYSTEGRSKRYGIYPELILGEPTQITYLERLSSSKKIERYTLDVLSEIDLNVNNIQDLVDSEYPKIRNEVKKNTTIKEDGSLTYDNGKKLRKIPKSSSMAPEEHLEAFADLKSKEVCKAHQGALEALKNKTYGFPKRNSTNYRLNHVLTNLPSRYLSKCTIEGEDLCEIDLKNSQFVLLANIIKNPSLLYRWRDIFINRTLSKESLRHDAYLRLLHPYRAKTDIQLFQEYCFNGALYEELCKLLPEKETTSSREKVKSLMFTLVFNEIENMQKTELYDRFNEIFPNVIKLIKLLKLNFVIDFNEMDQKEFIKYINKSGKVSRYKGAMNFLAVLLQRLEAKIFIDEILDTLRISGIKAISRHDSILIKISDQSRALRIIEDSLNNTLGETCFALKVTGLARG